MKRHTQIIAGFPGVGKSTFYNEVDDFIVLDSDSSKFNKDFFPSNYIDHIKACIGSVDVIFVSTHEDVLNALVENEIMFTVVYPLIGLKEEYIKRYKKRGSCQCFIDLIANNWDNWINGLMSRGDFNHVIIETGEGIDSIFENLRNGDQVIHKNYKGRIFTIIEDGQQIVARGRLPEWETQSIKMDEFNVSKDDVLKIIK